MKPLLLCAGLLQLSWAEGHAQQPTPSPADSAAVAAVERVERQQALDSLAAGRLRWERARIVEYRLETGHGCFCTPDPHRKEHRRNLLTIRNGRVVRRDVGKTEQHGGPVGVWWTVDSLFSVVAEDLQDTDRKVRRLDLHPEYGFPLRYEAGRTAYEDTWIDIVVDSFAVIRAAARNARRPHR
jgi:uncharacterized protein DUF6174